MGFQKEGLHPKDMVAGEFYVIGEKFIVRSDGGDRATYRCCPDSAKYSVNKAHFNGSSNVRLATKQEADQLRACFKQGKYVSRETLEAEAPAKVGDFIRYKGTKSASGRWQWFPGVKAGDVGKVKEIIGRRYYIKDDIRDNDHGVLLRNDFEVITEEEYKAGLRSNSKPESDKPVTLYDRWYKAPDSDWMVYMKSENYSFGFDKCNNWFADSCPVVGYNEEVWSYPEPSKEYVIERLLAEATKRFNIGDQFKVVHNPDTTCIIRSISKHSDSIVINRGDFHFNLPVNEGISNSATVMCNGKWAKPLKSKSTSDVVSSDSPSVLHHVCKENEVRQTPHEGSTIGAGYYFWRDSIMSAMKYLGDKSKYFSESEEETLDELLNI